MIKEISIQGTYSKWQWYKSDSLRSVKRENESQHCNNDIYNLLQGITTLEKKLTFAHHPKFGYLTFCPTNLGTTLRASVHIKIPNLSKHKNFKAICESLNLQPRGLYTIDNTRITASSPKMAGAEPRVLLGECSVMKVLSDITFTYCRNWDRKWMNCLSICSY